MLRFLIYFVTFLISIYVLKVEMLLHDNLQVSITKKLVSIFSCLKWKAYNISMDLVKRMLNT